MFKCGNVTVCGNWPGDEVPPTEAETLSGLQGNLLGNQPTTKSGMKTLVISLEALIYNTLQPLDDADFIINVEVDEIVYQVHVKKRPGKLIVLFHVNFVIFCLTEKLLKVPKSRDLFFLLICFFVP